MRLSRPSFVGPFSTTCGPILQPGPISTPAPMHLYGPISTSGAIFASSPMLAVGCMDIGTRWQLTVDSSEFGKDLRDFVAPLPTANCQLGLHTFGAISLSQLEASWPSTSATVENFQMPRICRSSVALSTS